MAKPKSYGCVAPFTDEELEKFKKALSGMEIPEWRAGRMDMVALTPFNTPEYSRFLATIAELKYLKQMADDRIERDRKRIEELEQVLGMLAGLRRWDHKTRKTMANYVRKISRKTLRGIDPVPGIYKHLREHIEELEKERDRTEGLIHVNEKLNLKILNQTATIERLRGALEPVWIVNDIAELGVKIGDRFFFLYKGGNIEYDTHDNGTPMKYRIVGKREFGETCQPKAYFDKNYHLTESGLYIEPLIYHEGLSDGKPEDGEWKPLPARQAIDGKED